MADIIPLIILSLLIGCFCSPTELSTTELTYDYNRTHGYETQDTATSATTSKLVISTSVTMPTQDTLMSTAMQEQDTSTSATTLKQDTSTSATRLNQDTSTSATTLNQDTSTSATTPKQDISRSGLTPKHDNSISVPTPAPKQDISTSTVTPKQDTLTYSKYTEHDKMSVPPISAGQDEIASMKYKMMSLLKDMRQQTDRMYESMVSTINGLSESVAEMFQAQDGIPKPPHRDCTDIADYGYNTSNQYVITPVDGQRSYSIFCDLDTDGGGWTVFQRRFDGSGNFYRGWQDYVDGFGKPFGEHWAGLELLHQLTKKGTWELLIHLEDFNGNLAFAHYASFRVGDAESNYRLSIGAYDGTAGDAMTADNHNKEFSTKDNDNDGRSWGNCAKYRRGAWWYGSCSKANLNGQYLGPKQVADTGLYWWKWKYSYEVLKRTEMKMRRIQ